MEEQMRELTDFLKKNGIFYELNTHEPVYTSEQAAKVRGVLLKTGVKAMVLKGKDFILALVPGDKKVDIRKLGKITGNEIRFAKPSEVLEVTGCEVGSVHPFGNLFNLKVYADPRILESKFINFNAGLHTHSIKMKSKDLIDLVKPELGNFAK